jgi:hypothetical protein
MEAKTTDSLNNRQSLFASGPVIKVAPFDEAAYQMPGEERALAGFMCEEVRALVMSRYPDAGRPMLLAGTHPDLENKLTNPYLAILPHELQVRLIERFDKLLAADNFANTGEHMIICSAAAIALERIAHARLLKQACSAAAYELIGHDNNKPFETGRKKLLDALKQLTESDSGDDKKILLDLESEVNKLGDRGRPVADLLKGIDPYSEAGYNNVIHILASQGIVRFTAERILASNSYAGHLSFARLSKWDDSISGYRLNTENMAGLITHFCDDITHSPIKPKEVHIIATPGQRMVLGDFEKRYNWMKEDGLRPNPDNLVSYMDMQPALSEAIAVFILGQIGDSNIENGSARLVELIREELRKMTQ